MGARMYQYNVQQLAPSLINLGDLVEVMMSRAKQVRPMLMVSNISLRLPVFYKSMQPYIPVTYLPFSATCFSHHLYYICRVKVEGNIRCSVIRQL